MKKIILQNWDSQSNQKEIYKENKKCAEREMNTSFYLKELDGASNSVNHRKEMISSLKSATFDLWGDLTFEITC